MTSLTTPTSTSTLSSAELDESLEIFEVKPGTKFSVQVLREILPDTETALFFGKVYDLTPQQTGTLLGRLFNSTLANALFNEGGLHSTDLQEYVDECVGFLPVSERKGKTKFEPDVPKGEILPELWRSLEIEVASSIKAVGEKLASVVGLMPGKAGAMTFKSMQVMNAKRPTIGDHKARIHHPPVKENLVILDDSGSVNSTTIQAIIEDVISMSYLANAHLCLISNSARHWEPGTYGVADVLAEAQYGGTEYSHLKDLLNRDWGVVVTIADYDGRPNAKTTLAKAKGHIDEVLDISIVNRPTFLAEAVGQRAAKVRPLLVAAQGNLAHSRW